MELVLGVEGLQDGVRGGHDVGGGSSDQVLELLLAPVVGQTVIPDLSIGNLLLWVSSKENL